MVGGTYNTKYCFFISIENVYAPLLNIFGGGSMAIISSGSTSLVSGICGKTNALSILALLFKNEHSTGSVESIFATYRILFPFWELSSTTTKSSSLHFFLSSVFFITVAVLSVSYVASLSLVSSVSFISVVKSSSLISSSSLEKVYFDFSLLLSFRDVLGLFFSLVRSSSDPAARLLRL